MDKTRFIETDDHRYVNLEHIVWMKKIMNCYYVCSKSNGCETNLALIDKSTGIVCEDNNKKGYDFLNNYINEKTI